MVAETQALFPRELWTPFRSSSRHDNWCTPQWVIDLILELWPEGIDTDPCTNDCSIVPSAVRYDCSAPELDGLTQPWHGRVYCNPPYSDPAPWYERAALHALKGCEVLLLVNVTTTTRAWNRFRPRQPAESFEHELDLCRRGVIELPRSSAVGFFNKRIGFLDAGAPIKSNEYEQMVLYWGSAAARFRELFSRGAAWCP
ncbi:DNA N-6-adenine-methyltransferase [Nannocystis pusilla]|uniref:DNA N-6-adenine-methyltransferase n=1 Tax=Nannocystis pusilla TaxID=889268 RepID=A0A9X3IZ01_9BACT|nr:DNA N-6-adenine-methyltransferase [Nannocystis pusilla]